MNSVESRIKALENENAARKAIYPVASSLVNFVQQISQVFHVRGGQNTVLEMVVKFTPDIEPDNGPLFVDLFPQVSTNQNFSAQFPKMAFYQLPRSDGEATVILGISAPFDETDFYVRIVATGSTRGRFTKM